MKISRSWSHLKNLHKILLTSCTPLSTSTKRFNSLKLLIWTSSDRPRMADRDERNQAQKRRRDWLEFYIQSTGRGTRKNTWLPVYVDSLLHMLSPLPRVKCSSLLVCFALPSQVKHSHLPQYSTWCTPQGIVQYVGVYINRYSICVHPLFVLEYGGAYECYTRCSTLYLSPGPSA